MIGAPGDDLKRYRRGTHRVVDPAQTLQRVRRALRRMGITRVANVTGLDRIGIPVALAVRPNARSLAVSQGKGMDQDAARASAVMESIELWHAERLQLPHQRATPNEMGERGLRCVELAALPRASSEDPGTRNLFWVPGEEQLDGGERWVPWECVSADYTLPAMPGCGLFAASSNGLASGNTHDEAFCHALCEVIERDAESLWRAGGLASVASTGIDPRSVRADGPRQLMRRFDQAGVDVRIWELTSDLGVPAFCCLVLGEEGDWADPEFGAGCHPDPEVALCRALTEAAQARVTFIAGSRDDLGENLYAPQARLARRRECERLATAHRSARSFDPGAGRSTEHVGEDRRWLLDRLAAVGVEEVVTLDLSQPQLGIPVLKVVVPGLEGPSSHEHCDYLPGARARRILDAAR